MTRDRQFFAVKFYEAPRKVFVGRGRGLDTCDVASRLNPSVKDRPKGCAKFGDVILAKGSDTSWPRDDVARDDGNACALSLAYAQSVPFRARWSNENRIRAKSRYERSLEDDESAIANAGAFQSLLESLEMTARPPARRPPRDEDRQPKIFALWGERRERMNGRVEAVQFATVLEKLHAIRRDDQHATRVEEAFDCRVVFPGLSRRLEERR